jgi:hypothetical protein
MYLLSTPTPTGPTPTVPPHVKRTRRRFVQPCSHTSARSKPRHVPVRLHPASPERRRFQALTRQRHYRREKNGYRPSSASQTFLTPIIFLYLPGPAHRPGKASAGSVARGQATALLLHTPALRLLLQSDGSLCTSWSTADPATPAARLKIKLCCTQYTHPHFPLSSSLPILRCYSFLLPFSPRCPISPLATNLSPNRVAQSTLPRAPSTLVSCPCGLARGLTL